jgi:hypothetical protein
MPESRANAAAAAKEASGAAAKPRNTKAMDEQARALADRRKLARAAQFLESVFYLFIYIRKRPHRSGAIFQVRWSDDVSGARPRHVRLPDMRSIWYNTY